MSSKSYLLDCDASDVLGMTTAEASRTIQDISWFLGIIKKKKKHRKIKFRQTNLTGEVSIQEVPPLSSGTGCFMTPTGEQVA